MELLNDTNVFLLKEISKLAISLLVLGLFIYTTKPKKYFSLELNQSSKISYLIFCGTTATFFVWLLVRSSANLNDALWTDLVKPVLKWDAVYDVQTLISIILLAGIALSIFIVIWISASVAIKCSKLLQDRFFK